MFTFRPALRSPSGTPPSKTIASSGFRLGPPCPRRPSRVLRSGLSSSRCPGWTEPKVLSTSSAGLFQQMADSGGASRKKSRRSEGRINVRTIGGLVKQKQKAPARRAFCSSGVRSQDGDERTSVQKPRPPFEHPPPGRPIRYLTRGVSPGGGSREGERQGGRGQAGARGWSAIGRCMSRAQSFAEFVIPTETKLMCWIACCPSSEIAKNFSTFEVA